MAGQPTPCNVHPPQRNKALLSGYLFRGGGRLGRGRLTSHNTYGQYISCDLFSFSNFQLRRHFHFVVPQDITEQQENQPRICRLVQEGIFQEVWILETPQSSLMFRSFEGSYGFVPQKRKQKPLKLQSHIRNSPSPQTSMCLLPVVLERGLLSLLLQVRYPDFLAFFLQDRAPTI